MSGVNGINGINVGGANFNNGVNGVVSKPVNNTSPQKPAENSDKKMSTGMKVGLGAAAVAVSVIAGLAIKNKAAAKKLAKNFIPDFEKVHGKIKDMGKEVSYENVTEYALNIREQFPNADKAYLHRLDKDGLKYLYKDVPKDLLGKKDGVLIAIFDEDNKLLASQPFSADSISSDLLDLFGGKSQVILK